MTTQTIEVNFESLNTLASQLRAAGAVLRVARGKVENFVITVIKPPSLVSIEKILTYSEPPAKPSNLVEDVLRDTNEIAFESVQFSGEVEAALEDATKPAKKSREKSTKSKLKLEDLPAFDNNDDIPF